MSFWRHWEVLNKEARECSNRDGASGMMGIAGFRTSSQ